MNVRHLSWLASVVVPLIATGAAQLLIGLLPHENIPLIYLAAVILMAVRASPGPAMVAALFSFLLYIFFFTEPRYTLLIVHKEELLTAALMLLIAALTGRLAAQLSDQVSGLRSRERYILAQLNLSQRLATLITAPEIARALQEAAVSVTPQITILVKDNGDFLQIGEPMQRDDLRLRAARDLMADRFSESPGSPDRTLIPMGDGRDILGVVICPSPSDDDHALIEVMVRLASLSLTRIRLVADLQAERFDKEREVLRSSLLSSVSHDLRTPLASVLGSASSLREFHESLTPVQRQELLDAIIDETDRLNRYIQNLLDMTRIGNGTLKAERDWASVEDIVAAAVRRIRPRLRDRRVEISVPGEMPLLFVQAAFIEQALFNLLDNSVKFSADGTSIRITACSTPISVRISVTDEGQGIPENEREKVFKMFHRAFIKGDNSEGSGLGLAIARGMVQAHDGTLTAEPGPAGVGTTMVIDLPGQPTRYEGAGNAENSRH
ncbi:MAG: DUF4118 domain-containing protein [Pseudomonadales bacterium]|nr:DUF4118 domain-containing protein [Pseudomonadales bacterium]